MNGKAFEAVPGSSAALVLVFATGGATNKVFSLDSDALILGKGRGCDLVLEAPDISAIHCVVTRSAGSYAIRDCGSRSGIRVNGDRVVSATLHEDDLIQVGPFSFKLQLPKTRPGGSKRDTPARLLRLERKRNNIIRLALGLRRQLREKPKAASARPEQGELEVTLVSQQAEQLSQRFRECEVRGQQLEQAERELASDRANLTREMEEFQEQIAWEEQKLKEQQTSLDRQATQRKSELEQQWRERNAESEKLWRTRQSELEQEWRGRRAELELEWSDRKAELEQDWQERQLDWDRQIKQQQESFSQAIKETEGKSAEDVNRARLELEQFRLKTEQELAGKKMQLEQEVAREREQLEQEKKAFQRELEERQVQLEEGYHQIIRQAEQEWESRRLAANLELQQRHQEIEQELQNHLQKAGQELDQRRTELEQEIALSYQALEEEFKQRTAESQGHSSPVNGAEDSEEVDQSELEMTCMLPLPEADMEQTQFFAKTPDLDEEEARRLLIRRHELDFFSQHLRRSRERLNAEHQELAQNQQIHTSERLEMQMANEAGRLREQRTNEPTESDAQFEQRQAELYQAEAMVRGQREAMMQMMADLMKMQEQVRPPQSPEIEAMRQENAELHQRLEEQFRLCEAQRHALEVQEQAFQELASGASSNGRDNDQLRGENELLQRLVEEKEAVIQELRQSSSPTVMEMPAVEDVDSYEAELVQFRRQLELERDNMRRELDALRIKNEELDDTTREIEMQLSKERAEMGRERLRLDRLREEIQSDLERLQRNGGLNERLAPVQKLREEIVENRSKSPSTPDGRKSSQNMNPGNQTPPPATKPDANGLGLLRSIRNK